MFNEGFFEHAESIATIVTGRADFRGKGRDPHDIWARAVLWRMLMTRCGLTLKEVGIAYGCHHTTILKAIAKLDPPAPTEQEARKLLPYVARPRHRFHTAVEDDEPGMAPRLSDYLAKYRRGTDRCAGCNKMRGEHK